MAMTEAARMARNEYARRWRKENPDKVAAIAERYWTKKAEALNAGANAGRAAGKG